MARTSNFALNKSVFVRGASSKYSTLLYDGVPIIDPSTLGGQYDLLMFSSDELSSIEIMRGGYSTLYGSSAVAGVINLRSIRPASDKLMKVEGYLGLGNLNTYQGNLKLHGTPIPASSNGLGLSYFIDLSRRQSQSISEATEPEGYKGAPFDRDGFNRNNLSTSVELTYGALRLRPYFRHSFLNNYYDAGSFADGLIQEQKGDLNVAGLDFDWQYAPSSYLRLKYAHQNRFRRQIRPSSDTTELFTENQYRGLFQFTDLYTNVQLDGVSVLSGVELRNEASTTTFSPTTFLRLAVAPYAIVQVNPFSFPLHLELGARYNYYEDYEGQTTFDVNPFYLLNDEMKVYASYASSFTAPNLFELGDPTYGNKDLIPEQSEHIEMGFIKQPTKLSTLADSPQLGLRIALFHRDIRDVIIWSPEGYSNRDQRLDLGLEIEPTLYLGQQLRLDMTYGFVEGTLTDNTPDPEGTPEEDRASEADRTSYDLARRPQHNFRAQLQWTPSDRLLLRANAQIVGTRTDLNFATYPYVKEELEPYRLYDLYASYKPLRQTDLRIFADIKNLLNQTDFQEQIGYATPGTRLMLGLRYAFE